MVAPTTIITNSAWWLYTAAAAVRFYYDEYGMLLLEGLRLSMATTREREERGRADYKRERREGARGAFTCWLQIHYSPDISIYTSIGAKGTQGGEREGRI